MINNLAISVDLYCIDYLYHMPNNVPNSMSDGLSYSLSNSMPNSH